MDNLHFIPNNILTKFFNELTKYKNDCRGLFCVWCIGLGLPPTVIGWAASCDNRLGCLPL